MGDSQLQDELDSFLAYARGAVLLWDDPDGRFAPSLMELGLPADVTLLREEEGSRFALKRRLNETAPDERLLVYRRRRHRVSEGDWFAEAEAAAERFEPDYDISAPAPPAESSPLLLEDGFSGLGEGLESDWYSLQAFRPAVEALLGGREGLPDEVLARLTGFKLYAGCAIRDTWKSATAYYESLLKGSLIPHASIPSAVRVSGSFKGFLVQRMARGLLLDYDDETWIGEEGLQELGIGEDDLAAFAREAERACDGGGVPYLTLPWLRSAAGMSGGILEYGLSDAFYESVLLMRRFPFGHSTLCGRHLFSLQGSSPRGRDFVFALIEREGSLAMGELLEVIRDEYGIPVPSAQLLQLVKGSGGYYRSELDRVYESHDRFVLEME